MITKYRTERTLYKKETTITPVVVERESEASVWINGCRREKITQYDRHHDTWEEAQSHLLADAERQVKSAHTELDRAIALLNNVKGMKKPE